MDYNATQADEAAYNASKLGPSAQCLFFSNLYYQCNKYFVHCFNSSVPTVNATVQGMCNTICFRSQSQCSGYDIQAECNNAGFYDPPPSCYMIDYGEVDRNNTWQYILGGIVGGLGLILGCSLLYQWIKKITWKPDPNAAAEFEDEKGKFEKEQKAGEQYQGLETARPFGAKDEFRTAQQARAEARERNSMQNPALHVNSPPSADLDDSTHSPDLKRPSDASTGLPDEEEKETGSDRRHGSSDIEMR
jgi:hypothetical protein